MELPVRFSGENNAAPQAPDAEAGGAGAARFAIVRGRLNEARYVLAVAVLLLLASQHVWKVPLAYALTGAVLLTLVAAFAPRRGGMSPKPATDRLPAALDTPSHIIEALPKPAFLLDAGGAITHSNPGAETMFPAARPGDPFTLTFRRPEIGDALLEAQAGRPRTVEFHSPGETANVYSMSLSPLAREAQGDHRVLVTFDDVSDRRAIARMRSDFVANASHELRTPLSSLTGFIETLLGPAKNDPVATDKFLRIMLDQARRMRRLLDDLLSLSRLEMRAHQRPREKVELTGILSHVVDALNPLAGEHSVVIELSSPSTSIEVVGDRDELVQVFQNLVENGIRYGASGGKVEISVDLTPQSPPAVAVHVRDHGPGIAPEHLPRLTERFYRVDVGASRDMKGTGLGLAIVKHILTRHQGQLAVESEPGHGARFTAKLPLPQVATQPAPNA